jgi:hypothetical protein
MTEVTPINLIYGPEQPGHSADLAAKGYNLNTFTSEVADDKKSGILL